MSRCASMHLSPSRGARVSVTAANEAHQDGVVERVGAKARRLDERPSILDQFIELKSSDIRAQAESDAQLMLVRWDEAGAARRVRSAGPAPRASAVPPA